jgi:hypothetical protein
MTARSDELAGKVEAAHNDLLAAIESANADEWRSVGADGTWTRGYNAYHAASSVEGITRMARRLASGEAPPSKTPRTWEEIDASNAAEAAARADCTPAETADLLRRHAQAAVTMTRALTDEELDRNVPPLMAGMPEVTVEQFVEMALIGHAVEHLRAITGAR